MFSFHRENHLTIDTNASSTASTSSTSSSMPPPPPPSTFGTWDPLSPVSDFNDSEGDFPTSTFRRRFSSSATTSSLPHFNIFQPPTDINSCKIPELPASMYYIPNFITEAEEQQLLNRITNAPKPHWTHLSHRRLLTYPSALTPNNILLNSPLPLWLTAPYIPRMQSLNLWSRSPHGQPNHVLINEYRSGEGIMPHEDGPAYHDMVATISLGAPIVLDIYEKNEMRNPEEKRVPVWRILQEPRSLLVTTGGMYTGFLHGIETVEVDEGIGPVGKGGSGGVVNWELLGDQDTYREGRYVRKVRTSLTYRDVLRVSNLGGKILGRR